LATITQMCIAYFVVTNIVIGPKRKERHVHFVV